MIYIYSCSWYVKRKSAYFHCIESPVRFHVTVTTAISTTTCVFKLTWESQCSVTVKNQAYILRHLGQLISGHRGSQWNILISCHENLQWGFKTLSNYSLSITKNETDWKFLTCPHESIVNWFIDLRRYYPSKVKGFSWRGTYIKLWPPNLILSRYVIRNLVTGEDVLGCHLNIGEGYMSTLPRS